MSDATDGFRSPLKVSLLSPRHNLASKQMEPIAVVVNVQIRACSVSNLQNRCVISNSNYQLLQVSSIDYYQRSNL